MSGRSPDYRAWLEKADEDRLCVANELKADRKPWSVICFCAQQAAEKHLKAFLAFHGAQPKKIHDLRVLLMDCGAFDASLVELENDCLLLNSCAVDIRYPDTQVEDEESMGRTAAAASDRICEAVRQSLPLT